MIHDILYYILYYIILYYIILYYIILYYIILYYIILLFCEIQILNHLLTLFPPNPYHCCLLSSIYYIPQQLILYIIQSMFFL